MNTLRYLDHRELVALAQRANDTTLSCSCIKKSLIGWESPLVAWPTNPLREIGSLIYAEDEELTLQEYHPDGTHYWSLDAPIAPFFFPYNRCKICECPRCGRCFLLYTESGAYHVEQRIRYLDPSLIVDAPLPVSAAS
jgi:hypothetical protein